jgi:DNA-binding HxlR family transcriptional regulator
MRTYGQYCALAKALDIVGDRWVLLIVRELLIRGQCRYSDLKAGLPGIATNLLAQRLRELEEAGVVERASAAAPISAPVYALTPRGKELEPAIAALGRWASPLMGAPAKGDTFQAHWLTLPAELFLADREPKKTAVTIEVRTGEGVVTLETRKGGVRASLGAADQPDATLSGPPNLVLGLLMGRITMARARAGGLRYTGRALALRRLTRVRE